jgi:hypothetical protein
MSNEIAPMQAFTDRLKEGLRDDVAKLMPDEMLSELIEKVVREEFFEGKPIRDNYSNRVTGIVRPTFHDMIIEAMTPTLQKVAVETAQRLAPEIDKKLREKIEAGVTQVIMKQVDKAFEMAMNDLGNNWSFQQAVEQSLRNSGILNR